MEQIECDTRYLENRQIRPCRCSCRAWPIHQQSDLAKGLPYRDYGDSTLFTALCLTNDQDRAFHDQIHPVSRIAFVEDCSTCGVSTSLRNRLQRFERVI